MKHPAKFLVLFDDTARALLFDSEQALLCEVIEEDGFIVDSLLRSATECPLPGDDVLRVLVPPSAPQQVMRCFELR